MYASFSNRDLSFSMEHSFKNKTIVIFSPQPWNHISISKHHYAIELSKNNSVYFISSPQHRLFKKVTIEQIEKKLYVINYSVRLPEWTKFKLKKIYKTVVQFTIKGIMRTQVPSVDYSFDFGCYQFFDSSTFFPSAYRIFFPVDDFLHLKDDLRGANIAFTVSTVIQKKIQSGACHFINHGLSEDFIVQLNKDILERASWQSSSKTKVGYAGNIFLRFIDFEVFEKLITANPTIEFHFFGNSDFNPANESHKKWKSFLDSSSNVIFRGWMNVRQLAEAYHGMDLFLICYKADNQNYHGENSHKLLEYLSTGKVIVTSYISLYEGTDMLEMDTFENNGLGKIFSKVVQELDVYNAPVRMQDRRNYARENSYAKQLERMTNIMNEQVEKR